MPALSPAVQRRLESSVLHRLRPVVGRTQAEGIAQTCVRLAVDSSAADGVGWRLPQASQLILLLCLSLMMVVGALLLTTRDAEHDEPEDELECQATSSSLGPHAQKRCKKPIEVLALFSNPVLPPRAAEFGLRPLAFGQDLKLLMHALPATEIDIEPAATLAIAREALIRGMPRILLFSGHTITGALAFETPEGRIDLHADRSYFVTLMHSLSVDLKEHIDRLAKRQGRPSSLTMSPAGLPEQRNLARGSSGRFHVLGARSDQATQSLASHLQLQQNTAAAAIQRHARGYAARHRFEGTTDVEAIHRLQRFNAIPDDSVCRETCSDVAPPPPPPPPPRGGVPRGCHTITIASVCSDCAT